MAKQTQADVKNQLASRTNGGQVSKNGNGNDKNTVTSLLQKMKPEFERALPQHMDADRLTRIALTEIRQNPDLLNCEPKSLMGAVMQCAQLGLEPGLLGHAYLVPFNNRRKQPDGSFKQVKEVQFLIGYKGLIDLVRRSGDVTSIVANEVRENDEFEFEYGLEEKLSHKPKMNGKRGEITCFYAYARFKDGGHAFLVMTTDEINAIRDEHSAGYKYRPKNNPWNTNYESMAKKTVIRQLIKYLPISVEIQRSVSADETVKRGVDEEPEQTEFIDVEAYEVNDNEADSAAQEEKEQPEAQDPFQEKQAK